MTDTPGTDTDAAVEAALDELLDLLDVQQSDDGSDTFRGKGSGFDEFGLYGGHVLAQAVVAAQRTVDDDRPMNSVHAVFLRGGDGLAEVDYKVDRVRDGRAFCTRRSQAFQSDRLIFELTATFHVPETGKVDIQTPLPGNVPPPTSVPTFQECIAQVGPIFGEQWSYMTRPVEFRLVHAPWAPTGPSPRGGIDYWFRAPRLLPDDPAIHEAIISYMSDDCLADNVIVPYGVTWLDPSVQVASLDHAMWFHEPARADEWIYCEQRPLMAGGNRGTSEARFWQNGRLVATAVQEALARL
ncbi:MAG: thioesterase family protein [Acidimicrobiaceae bacterium]|nr:thioesterase family protein [Acidimicrobiaceae bacterium]MYA81510.1 acyl-CoA thioesterase II [Acidimicrobiales bacterium]MYH74330.1 acyl-CoA thioesterase II [Acidimicrobiales bacterium]MYK71998.1 acyl-CoA thioesterase II [Acidimicrobiales bacterium]